MQCPFRTISHRYIVPVQSNLLNLRSFTLQYCSPEFLPHLFEHLPQLEQFNCHLYKTSCVFQQQAEHHFPKYVSLFGIIYSN